MLIVDVILIQTDHYINMSISQLSNQRSHGNIIH